MHMYAFAACICVRICFHVCSLTCVGISVLCVVTTVKYIHYNYCYMYTQLYLRPVWSSSPKQ